MTQGALASLAGRIDEGIVAGPRARGTLPPQVEWIETPHPLPDERSVRAAARALELGSAARAAGDLLLVLLSGGGSAMLAAPVKGLSLADKQRATESLIRAGADITQLNCVRKHLSSIKGGQLALSAGLCQTFALSDVHLPQDDPGTIASGPTVADPSTYEQALAAIHDLECEVPAAVRAHLERGAAGGIPETPKPGDARFGQGRFVVVGNRHTAMDGAAREAARRGYVVRIVDAPATGEARAAGRTFADLADGTPAASGSVCVIASGETTVRVRGAGRGGRNQEFVLGAAGRLAKGPPLAIVASAGTDGVDGPTDASGALASSTTLERASKLGFDLKDVLERNDAYVVLERLDDLIKWGPTLTNVGDVHVLLTMRP
jgi:hydroxypyruvate reductase